MPSSSSDSSPVQRKNKKNGSVVEDVDHVDSAEKGAGEDYYRKEKPEKKSYGYGEPEDLSLWTKFELPVFGEIRFNPIVTFLAIVLIWGFVVLCSIQGDKLPFHEWRAWAVDTFTWLYIGSQNCWMLFAVVLYFSKYSQIKLGKDDDEPEYSDPTWFMMLFACGIGTGLFFFGVAEPMFHYTSPSRYTNDPFLTDNVLAQNAMNVTLFHWGLHAWIVYSFVGLLLALLSFREKLPMTMKSCFYPLIGDRVFGWMGDLIDIVSIITTLFGVCTSLGLGTRQLNTGLSILDPNIPSDDITIQIIIIWCITAVATISTVSGVGMGIRRLSETCFMVGMFLMIVALFLDNTAYILNLYVQSIGYYFTNLFLIGFHTDAFEQLGPSTGGADQRGRFVPEGRENTDGPADWMDSWTMFYWGWWISWCPFVGMFIAKISRGRTIRQFINGTLTAPVIYTFLWLVIFGGAGIRQERASAGEGLCCQDKSGWFENITTIHTMVNQESIDLEAKFSASSAAAWMCQDDGECGPCAKSVLEKREFLNKTFGQVVNEYQSLGKDFGSVSEDRRLARLSCHPTEQMWFDVIGSYGDVGPFLSVFSLVGIILYFITSSDSGSLVIDCLSANGDPDPPRLQRVFWAMTEGATATALLAAGGKDALLILQAAGLLCGLPYNILVWFIILAIWRAVKVAAGELDPFGPAFKVGLFDPLAPQPYTQLTTPKYSTGKLFAKFVMNIFLGPITLAKIMARLNNSRRVWAYAIAPCLLFFLAVLFHFLQLAFDGAWAMAWFFYLGFATLVTSARIDTRGRFDINGSVVEDFLAGVFAYPLALVQMDMNTQDLENDGDSESKKRDVENIGMQEKNSKQGAGGLENVAYVSNEDDKN